MCSPYEQKREVEATSLVRANYFLLSSFNTLTYSGHQPDGMHREYRFQSPDRSADFTQHLQELQNRTAFFGVISPGITRGTPGGYGRIILA